MSNLLKKDTFKCSVSSVLNRDARQHGKAFLFDGCEDTAWSSDQGAPQHIAILFDKPATVGSIAIQFQGGFAGKDCLVSLDDAAGQLLHSQPFYPDDINAKQAFTLKATNAAPASVANVTKVRVQFKGSTDFFGRIIVYSFELFE